MRDEDDDLPQQSDLDRFGDAGLKCPTCDRFVYDELETCPHCGEPMSKGGGAPPKWAIATAAVLIALMLLGMLAALLARN